MAEASDVIAALSEMQDEAQRLILLRFFKTGPGEYGEGDRFLGLRVPQTREVVKRFRLSVPLDQIAVLLQSQWHEVRLCGFLLLVEEMKAATPSKRIAPTEYADRREQIARFYLTYARRANNWDLVDLSAGYILGAWLLQPCADGTYPDRRILDDLAGSTNLWEQRIAIVSTSTLIRAGQYEDTLRIADVLLGHPHDLIHKAVGWMLREVGKKDIALLRRYLSDRYSRMPRTALRYAIERMDAPSAKHGSAADRLDQSTPVCRKGCQSVDNIKSKPKSCFSEIWACFIGNLACSY